MVCSIDRTKELAKEKYTLSRKILGYKIPTR
ncbi:hypothetical protein CRJUMX01_1610004 [Escherichia coli]|nr:hypothetical protein CRJUMX01_1610004 [Escherichia coli]